MSPRDFICKIKHKYGQFDKCKVRLVIQGQHMRRKDDTGAGDFEDAFSPVPHASGFRTILSLATQHHMLCDHVDISQAFVQGDLLPGDGHNGKVYISPPPGYTDDDGFSTSSGVLSMVCLALPVLGIPPRALISRAKDVLLSDLSAACGVVLSLAIRSSSLHTLMTSSLLLQMHSEKDF